MSRNDAEDKLVVAISSSALFDLEESDRVYREQGVAAYADYQIEHETEVLQPGYAYQLVVKLLNLNKLLDGEQAVEVILLSRNTADTGLRVFNSIQHHNLPIIRAAFTGGSAPYRYMKPFGCQLFLSTNANDVREALNNGSAAASIVNRNPKPVNQNPVLKFAFDGDAVLFSDEAERIYQEKGLDAFQENESLSANKPLAGGPFKPFLSALHNLQNRFEEGESPIRTALVTARSAPSHERVIKTLRQWDVRLDESMFLGGMKKSEFLRAYEADVFFDDQAEHCALASEYVATGHVLHGVTNQLEKGDLDANRKER